MFVHRHHNANVCHHHPHRDGPPPSCGHHHEITNIFGLSSACLSSNSRTSPNYCPMMLAMMALTANTVTAISSGSISGVIPIENAI
eukprot:scaffold193864_cov36-Prasinocladus_malaysianus.AAC.1